MLAESAHDATIGYQYHTARFDETTIYWWSRLMKTGNQMMPDHPLYIQARDAHRAYLQSKERGDSAAAVDRLRLIYEAQIKAATDYHLHSGTVTLPVQ